ncbi:hypothetical protein [Streptomyces sp. NPDC048641]|uniref:hypothetical protein n=1 Tax=Streptomyces sp. NPDC048641 TaxID=3154825 RepID=UPI003440D59E
MRQGRGRRRGTGPGPAEGGGDGEAFVGSELVVVFVSDGVFLPPAGEQGRRVVLCRAGHALGPQIAAAPGTEVRILQVQGVEQKWPEPRGGMFGTQL